MLALYNRHHVQCKNLADISTQNAVTHSSQRQDTKALFKAEKITQANNIIAPVDIYKSCQLILCVDFENLVHFLSILYHFYMSEILYIW